MNISLIKGLQFAEKVNQFEPVTESGKQFIKRYRGYLYQNPANFSLVNNFISEAQKYSYDTGVMSILESVLKFVTENKISWKIASVCESINASTDPYNYINKMGAETAEKLLDMNESEVVQYIKAGALKSVQYIPEFREICKEVYGTSHVEEQKTQTYSLTSPISYTIVNENEQWFVVNGYTYKISEGKVTNEVCEDNTFNRINSLLPNFKMVDEKLQYSWQPSTIEKPYTFTIDENNIKFEHGTINESFNNVIDFRQFCDNFTVMMLGANKNMFMNIANNVASVQEAFDSICEIDCAKVLECADGTVANIVEAKDNIDLTWVKSYKCKPCTIDEKFMSECCKSIRSLTGVNLSTVYENRINEELKEQNPEEYQNIQEELKAAKDQKIEERRNKIQMLAEQFKHDPAKLALLSTISKDLSILENNSK